jgi:hypothetical protein
MDQATVNLLTAAIIVAAVAIVIQLVVLIVIAIAARATQKRIAALVEKIEPLTGSAQDLLRQARTTFTDVSAKTSEILELSRRQLGRVDELVGEATSRVRSQMDRVELVIDDTVNRFQETTTILQDGVVKPLRQLSGLTAGIRTTLAVLFGGRRTTPEHATHDEEMFI